MIFPTVHLNGTSKEALIDDLTRAYTALTSALTALALAEPNGRDYYPQGPDALKTAQAEHKFRLQRVEDVRKEILEIAEHIDGGS
jgi:hypothetical protein